MSLRDLRSHIIKTDTNQKMHGVRKIYTTYDDTLQVSVKDEPFVFK